jgi:hypothetical protein
MLKIANLIMAIAFAMAMPFIGKPPVILMRIVQAS